MNTFVKAKEQGNSPEARWETQKAELSKSSKPKLPLVIKNLKIIIVITECVLLQTREKLIKQHKQQE